MGFTIEIPLQWGHNERVDVSNHRRLDCLLKRLFSRKSKKTTKLRVTGLCEGNPPLTGGFPSQKTSNAENVPFGDVIIYTFHTLNEKLQFVIYIKHVLARHGSEMEMYTLFAFISPHGASKNRKRPLVLGWRSSVAGKRYM